MFRGDEKVHHLQIERSIKNFPLLLSLLCRSIHRFLKLGIAIPFLVLILMKNFSSAQDSLHLTVDSVHKENTHSPQFAGIASAILPGAGQVYNRKYWKVPIVYAGLATAGFFAYFNANVYFTVKKNLDSRIRGDSVPSPQFLILNSIVSKSTVNLNNFSSDELLTLEEDYRKYFTISLIAGGVVYFLNILDAVVDAHLYHFDVGDDLSLDIRPQIFSSFSLRTVPGLSISLNIK
jgi:hypothetical protein